MGFDKIQVIRLIRTLRLWHAILALWVFFWIFFLARGMVKGEYDRFRSYALAGYGQKVSLILGTGLHSFLEECLDTIPESGTYKIVGGLDEHDRHRMAYYLYPRTRSERPDYILYIDREGTRYEMKRVR
jgi:hypothetical protein